MRRPRRNPEGIAPSVPQTQTPAFRRWFGDSKVVDERGEPLIVYHGTDKGGFYTFDMNKADPIRKGMMFFTNELPMARTYTKGREDPTPPIFSGVEEFLKYVEAAGDDSLWSVKKEYYVLSDEDGTLFPDLDALNEEWEDTEGDLGVVYTIKDPDGFKLGSYDSTDERQMSDLLYDVNQQRFDRAGIYEVYLRIVDPWVVDAKGASWEEIPIESEDEDGNRRVILYTTNELAHEARRMGCDGLIIRDVFDAGSGSDESGDVYVVFRATQIKSAYGNVGTFDPNNDDIRRNPTRRRRPASVIEEGWPHWPDELKEIVESYAPEFFAALTGPYPDVDVLLAEYVDVIMRVFDEEARDLDLGDFEEHWQSGALEGEIADALRAWYKAAPTRGGRHARRPFGPGL